MRYVFSLAALAALSFVLPATGLAQGLSVTNYRLISTERVNSTLSYHTLAADLVNSGAARSVVTATVSSPVANLQIVPGSQNLHFSPVPAGSQVASLDTFRLLVNTTVPIDYNQLQWVFTAPFANAGPNQTVPFGQTVLLNGSGSSNPAGGGFLQYNWTFLSRPPGSSARIQNSWDVMANFVADVQGGTWIVQLTVTNSAGSDVAVMTVTTGNSLPVANAGANQTVAQGALVTLNGSGSTDVDGDPLTYAWTLPTRPSGSTAVLSNPSAVSPTFIADRPGTYIARLVVNDGKGNSAPANVTITTQNTAPVANAGPAQSVTVGALVTLNGSASTDVDGNPLTYAWTLITRPAGSVAALSNPSSVMPSFTIDLAGTYVAQLIVNDGQVNSIPSTVTITTNGSLAPTAIAGPNQTVRHSSLVQLTGNGTDPQSRPLTYAWSLITVPSGSVAVLSNPSSRTPTFTADRLGIYVAQLIVNNGIENSAPSTVTINTTNTAPVANPGTTQTAAVNSLVTLNGTFSSDADGDALTYAWTFSSRPAGSTATLQAATSSTPSFTPDVAGAYVIQLIVSDIFAASVPATVTVNAGSNGIVLTPDPLTLTGGPALMTATISTPAPFGGQLINLNSSSPSVATVPFNVTVPQNATFVTFNVTPAGNGTSTITATAPGFRPGAAVVTAGTPAISVTLGNNNTVGLTRTINGTVTLSAPAGPFGASVNVNASPSGIVTLGNVPVQIAPGQTTGTFTVTGVATGVANITASAAGYSSGNTQVTSSLLGQISVEKNVTLAPGETRAINVSIASAAPPGGVVIAIQSSNTGAVQVSGSVTIAAGNTTPSVPATVTGVAFGVATITASAAGYTGDSSSVTVGSSLSFSPTSISLASGGQQNLLLSLSGPAASNTAINLGSSNPSAATVPASVVILQNQTSVQVPVTALTSGSTTITATPTVANISPATASVTVSSLGGIQMPGNTTLALGQTVPVQVSLSQAAPLGGVTLNLSVSGASVSLSSATVFIAAGATTPAVQPTMTGAAPGSANVTAAASGFGTATQTVNVTATLTFTPATSAFPSGSSRNNTLVLSGPAPAGGLIVSLSSSSGGTASVPASVTIPAGATSVQVPVNGLVPGSAVITASAVGVTSGTLNVTVQNSGAILVSNVTVAPGQSAPLIVTLPAPAAINTTVALVSNDPTRATLSQSTVTVLTGQTQALVPPSVSGVSFGNTTITASANGFAPGTGQVTVGAALSFAQSNLIVNSGSPQSVQLSLSVVAPAGGIPVTFTSTNGAVLQMPFGTTIAQNSGGVNFVITGATPGTTVITASTSLPNITPATLTVTVPGAVGSGTISLPVNSTITVGQTAPFPFTLSNPAGPGGVQVTLTTADGTRATISPSSVTVLAGQVQPAAQPQVTGVGAGIVNISAAAPGYTTATQPLSVSGAGNISLSPGTLSIVSGAVQNLTVTVPVVAGPGGKLVTLSSSNIAAASVPASVTVPEGATSTSVPVTGSAPGTATITASASAVGQATSTITVTAPGAIILPSNFLVGPGQTRTFPVTLASPAAVTTTVTLTSADLTKMTFSPATITFNAGQTTPTTAASVTGIAEASVAVSATGPGLSSASTSVRVGFSMSFTPNTLGITGTGTSNLILTLSSAPAVNTTINLSSASTGVATVPATVLVVAGATSVNVPVTGVTSGTSVITAVTPSIPATTATVTVSAANIISVPALSVVSLGKFVQFPITLPSPAGVFGVTVTITSEDTSKVIVPGPVFIAPGQTQPAVQPQLLGENVGDVNITASAPGYLSGVGVVKVGTTATWQLRTIELSPGQSRVAFTDLGASAPGQPPFPGDTGVRINFVSSNPAVATVRDFITAYPDGSEFTTIAVVINGQAPGTAIISSSGINIPVDMMTVIVNGPLGITTASLPNGSVGAAYSHTLQGGGGVAPRTWSLISGTLPNGLTLNQTTGLISGTPTQAVNATPLTFRLTDNASPTPTSVTVSLSLTIATGSVGATMTLTPSPLAITGTATQNLNLSLSVPAPPGGLVVNLNSSLATVATVPASVTVPGGSSSILVPVTGVTAGTTTITASANGYGQAIATVNVSANSGADIILPQNLIVPPGDFRVFPVTLAAPATSATFITLAINDSSRATLSQTSIFINTGQTAPSVQPRLNGLLAGPITVTATAFGLTSATTDALIGFGFGFTPNSVNLVGTSTQNITLSLSSPSVTTVVANLVSSNTGVASVPPTVTFSPGASTANVPVTGVGAGATVITASAAGFTSANANVTVAPPGNIIIPAVAVPLGQSVALPISLSVAAPAGGLTVSLANSQTDRVTVPATVTIPAGQTTPASPVMVTGINVGPSTITASAPTYLTNSAVVNVNTTLAWVSTSPFILQGGQQPVQLRMLASSPFPINGGVPVTLSSSNPSVATVQSTISFFPDGNPFTTLSINVSGVTPGTAVITAEGLNIPPVTLTVTVVGPVSISTDMLPAGSVNIPYSQSLAAAGGRAPFTWELTAGTLPNGLSLSPTTGVISGTPTLSVTNTPLTFQVSDSSTPAQTATRALTLSISALTPTSVTLNGGNNQNTAVNTLFAQPLSVIVKDINDAPVQGITVTFTRPASGASATFAGNVTTAVTDLAGIATSPAVTANTTPGAYQITASVAGIASPVNFSLTNNVGPAASIAATSGTPQNATTSTQFAAPLAATVLDAFSNPVAGVVVTFAAPASGASGTFAGGVVTAITNAAGVATSALFTANASQGSYVVTASTPNAAAPASFNLTNTSGAVSSIVVSSGSPQNTPVSSAFALPLRALVRDGGSNPVPGVLVTFTVPASGASATFAGGVNTALTDAAGIATSAILQANATIGNYVVEGRVSGVAAPANFSLSNTTLPPASVAVSSGSSQSAVVGTTFAARLAAVVRDANGVGLPGVTVTFAAPAAGASGSFFGGVNTAVTNASGIATSAQFTANLQAGGYVVTATVGALPPASFSLTNTAIGSNGPQIQIPNVQVGKNLQALITISIPSPAGPGGQRITLTPTNYDLIRVAGRQAEAGGTAPLTVVILEGLTQATGIYVQGLESSGRAEIIASSAGFTDTVSTVTLFPSAVVVSGPNGAAGSFEMFQGASATLTVQTARLTATNNLAEFQPLKGGIFLVFNPQTGGFDPSPNNRVDVTLSNSTASVGSVSPDLVTIFGGDASVTTTFASNAVGMTTVTAQVPSGFVAPAGGANNLAINVVSSSLVGNPATVGRNLQVATRFNLNSPAPNLGCFPVGAQTVCGMPATLTSSDSSRLLLSVSGTSNPLDAGAASISFVVPAGRVASQDFFVQGLQSSGTATYTISAPGFSSATATVNLTPSGFVLFSPFGRGADFFTTIGAANSELSVLAGRLDTNFNFVEAQPLRGGLSVNVGVTIPAGQQTIGTITASPLAITGPNNTAITQFDPNSVGTANISIIQPAGFDSPVSGSSLNAQVRTPQMSVQSVTVGRNLQTTSTLLLGQPAPAGGLNVTLTSGSAQVLLSPNQVTPGSGTLVVNVPGGQSAAFFVIQGFADSGVSSFSVSAPGYVSTSGTVTLAKSGIIISSIFGAGATFTTTVAAGNQPVTISTALLDASGIFQSTQPLAAGLSQVVTLTSGTPAVGTLPASATITGGSSDAVVSFTPVAGGQTTLSVTQPGGYTLPTQFSSLLARVNP